MVAQQRPPPWYLIWSHEHAAWWAPGCRGYTRRLSEAGRYSPATAMEICERATHGAPLELTDLPVRLDDILVLLAAYRARYPRREEPWM
jgi:hypothetical protein